MLSVTFGGVLWEAVMSRFLLSVAWFLLTGSLLATDVVSAIKQGAPRPVLGMKPLTEMSATDKYYGEDGGLYGGGKNEPPAKHLAAAKLETARIMPLDNMGKPQANGKIVLVSISMSNATQEFSVFKRLADADADKSPK